MATTKFYITSGLPPNDTADTGSTKTYITSGFPPADTVAASGSASESASPSTSESASISPSLSESASESASASAAPLLEGSVCWGHVTGVVEDNVETFVDDWTGTGLATGAGDAEVVELESGEYMESSVVNTGSENVELLQNYYNVDGDDVILKYRHGATEVACEAASYTVYSIAFSSLGFVQVRIEATP